MTGSKGPRNHRTMVIEGRRQAIQTGPTGPLNNRTTRDKPVVLEAAPARYRVVEKASPFVVAFRAVAVAISSNQSLVINQRRTGGESTNRFVMKRTAAGRRVAF